MKKLLVLLVLTVFIAGLYADLMVPTGKTPLNIESFKRTIRTQSNISREAPEYEFVTDPINLITNFYDYMPGSYCGIPVQIEDDGSVYIVFHARETLTSTRRVYFAYIDSGGNVQYVTTIGTEDIHEGYAGIDLDPITGDPITAWHGNYDTQTVDREVVCSYDLYHTGNPGFWRTPFIIIDETIPTVYPTDEFIWPYVHIGPSPDPLKRRVYVFANNYDSNPNTGFPCENVLIAYADFDAEDLENQSELNWTYRVIPLLDEWHSSQEFIRPFLSPCVSDDGKVALIGYTNRDEGTDSLVVFLNTNFGIGEFDYYSSDARFEVWDPWGGTEDLYFTPCHCNHQNSIFTDNSMKIRFMGTMGLSFEGLFYYPYMIYPKIYTFDISSQEFSFYDLYIEGANPSDNNPMLPWDLNEDGIIDSLLPNGDPYMVEGFPLLYFDESTAYHVNTFKIVKNEEKGWLAAVWHDGLKSKYAHEGVPGYEEWLEVPEIVICISADNGETWSEPIFMNSIETPEYSDMIPCYIYPGDLIEDLGDDHGKLHLFFLDDYEYGIYGQGGINLGGMQMYASLNIDFGPFVSAEDETVPQVTYELYNYPNPFNPETTISYQLSADSPVELSIYNIKGQKVKTLVNETIPAGEHSVVWNGRDSNGNRVSSGIYFYKLETGDFQRVRKMILLK